MSRRLVPVAVSGRDGHGEVFSVEVASGRLRISVPILGPDGALVGEVVPDGSASGVAHWDPQVRRKATWQTPIAPAEVRRELAGWGRLSAVLGESGTVIAFRVEPGISR